MTPPAIADRQFEGVVVGDDLVHERLRLARMARGLTIETMAKRSGVRGEWLRAIDAGRFGDLPAGIYARSAMRAYAAALDFNVDEILRLTASLLPAVEDPIDAMRRLNGIPMAAPSNQPVEKRTQPSTAPDWRVIAASAIDAAAMAFGLVVLVTCTVAMGLPMSVLDHAAAGPLFAVMLLVAALYFVVFGGIVGRTIGEYAVGAGTSAPVHLNLQEVAARNARSHPSRLVLRRTAWPMGRPLDADHLALAARDLSFESEVALE